MPETPAARRKVLILAGTAEATALAVHLREQGRDEVLLSYAGAVRALPDTGVARRIGGFGGVDGLVQFLRSSGTSLVIDATHPFAAQMSRNACAAAQMTGIPLIRLERPRWTPEPGDDWRSASSAAEAAVLLPQGASAFLCVSMTDLPAFAARPGIEVLARMNGAPAEGTLPASWQVILNRPGATPAMEHKLMRRHRITHLVTRNSGGSGTAAKLVAARALFIPVIMIERPPLPPAPVAATLANCLGLMETLP
jgi:precorrin-6A/cobalt-precorrin-6A reductase